LGKRDQFTVGVAAHEQHAIVQVEQAIKDRDRLRSGRVVTGDNDQVTSPPPRPADSSDCRR
jgi:hypothetical protein